MKRILIALFLMIFIASIWAFFSRSYEYGGILLTGSWVVLASIMLSTESLKSFAYTCLILAAVTISLTFPQYFRQYDDFKFTGLIVPLLQLITFGVGCTMSLADFTGVVKMPKGVIIGTLCHYTIMPLVGYCLANAFNFPPEIAAGIILVGCSPSGLASNVIAYLAKANLALSVTITAVSTLLSPLMTPLLMKLLGGQFVPVNFFELLLDVLELVIIPIFAGMLFNRIFRKGIKLINLVMPKVSMLGIAMIIVVTTSAGRDSLLNVGHWLIIAMFLHMTCGCILGYWGARLFGLNRQDARTVAIEVGMQNGGLASGSAAKMGKIATVGLAPAINGPLMNTLFSLIGTWWGQKSVADKHEVHSNSTVAIPG